LGSKVLKLIAENRDIKYFKNSKKKENLPLPCRSGEEWLTFIPANKDFVADMEKQFGTVFSFITHIGES